MARCLLSDHLAFPKGLDIRLIVPQLLQDHRAMLPFERRWRAGIPPGGRETDGEAGGGGILACFALQGGDKDITMIDSFRVRAKAWVLQQVLSVQGLTEMSPEAL